jgi:hypothetical protein
MSWETGDQKRVNAENFNQKLKEKIGHLEEGEAQILLYKFLRENITFTTSLISGVELFPFQHMAIKAMFETDYTLGVWSRGMSKSFTTGIYAFLDAILNQGVEIGILSKSFRQSKMIFKKIEDIAAKPEAHLLAKCITHKSKSNDEWLMEIGRSRIRALPLGDGSKLRGFRFHRIIIDEFLLMPERIYNEVIVPFLSVVENPVERERMYQVESSLIAQGKMKEEDRYKWPNNKLIALSSASYKFEYLYKLYEQFEALINGSIKEDGDATRCIMQFSYDCAPKKLYDENLILQSKATMSQSQFDREFGAIFTDDSSGYFKTSRMAACTIPDGEDPSVEVKGNPADKYILSFDPSWAESESSDDFAMQIYKLNESSKTSTLVHAYALPGTNLKHHIVYFNYLLKNFNIVAIVGDYNGGVQFINAVNESALFKKENIKIKMISSAFDKPEEYQEDLSNAKKEYDPKSYRYCILRKPTSQWIRTANELLQSSFDHKKIWFAARAVDDSYHKQIKQKIPIKNLRFNNVAEIEEKQNDGAKMIDFVEHQHDMINATKSQCALIQIKSTPQGNQTFDLPDTLKRTTGPNKARKDSYSAIVLGNWMTKIYFDFVDLKQKPINNSFMPLFIK